MATEHGGLGLVDGGLDGVLGNGIPVADGDGGIEVVGTDEDEDGVEIVAMLGLELLCLIGDVVPLTSADGIDIGFDVEPRLQPVPPFLLRAAVTGVGDAVAEIGHPLSLPWVLHLHHGLCAGSHGEHKERGEE